MKSETIFRRKMQNTLAGNTLKKLHFPTILLSVVVSLSLVACDSNKSDPGTQTATLSEDDPDTGTPETPIDTGDGSSMEATDSTSAPIEGLIAEYLFDSNALDSSGNNNHATLNTIAFTTDRNGRAGFSLEFDGTDSFVETPFERSSYLNLTMCAWYRFDGDAQGDYQTIFSGDTTDFYVGKDKGNTNIGIQEGNYNPAVAVGTNAWDGSWRQLCYVYATGQAELYIDGVSVGSANMGLGNGLIWLGRENEGSGFIFTGAMDDVRIYDRALSASEITMVP